MDFEKKYGIFLERAEKTINKFFKETDIPQKSVFEAMRYAITGGGKRLRPVLVMAAAELCGADENDAAIVGLAVECVHNYSLIHDDLPCMDDDELRRGRATCHVKFGEDIAVLAGDGLLNAAFEILANTDNFNTLSSGKLLRIIRCLADSSGAYGIIGGQVVDIESEKKQGITKEQLDYLHSRKTGALIRAAVRCGCLCGECDERIHNATDLFAAKLGLAFQIKDDILDVEGDQEKLGKPVGSDEKSEKTTYVSLFGIERAKEYLKEVTNSAISSIDGFGEEADFLRQLALWLLQREK